MGDDSAAAMAELFPQIARGILTSPELSDPEWDSYALVAEISDSRTALMAYRYPESGPPVATEAPDDDEVYETLRERTRGVDGTAWDVVLVKVHRDTVNLVMAFFTGADAEPWRIVPQNMEHLPEAMRPRPEDFTQDAG